MCAESLSDAALEITQTLTDELSQQFKQIAQAAIEFESTVDGAWKFQPCDPFCARELQLQ